MFNNYREWKVVGEGAYGIVYRCFDAQRNDYVAVKKFKHREEEKSQKRATLMELKALTNLRHENIIHLHNHFYKDGHLYMVLDFVEKTLLNILEENKKGVERVDLLKLGYELCKGVSWCHGNNVIHRDIKPENLLVTENLVVKLCDFGFSRSVKDDKPDLYTDYVATRWYRAPELILGDVYGKPVDVWAIGCILAEMADGQPLFPGTSEIDQLHCIQAVTGQILTDQQMRVFKRTSNFIGCKITSNVNEKRMRSMTVRFKDLDSDLFTLIKELVQINPDFRSTAAECLEKDIFELVRQQIAEAEHKLKEANFKIASGTAALIGSMKTRKKLRRPTKIVGSDGAVMRIEQRRTNPNANLANAEAVPNGKAPFPGRVSAAPSAASGYSNAPVGRSVKKDWANVEAESKKEKIDWTKQFNAFEISGSNTDLAAEADTENNEPSANAKEPIVQRKRARPGDEAKKTTNKEKGDNEKATKDQPVAEIPHKPWFGLSVHQLWNDTKDARDEELRREKANRRYGESTSIDGTYSVKFTAGGARVVRRRRLIERVPQMVKVAQRFAPIIAFGNTKAGAAAKLNTNTATTTATNNNSNKIAEERTTVFQLTDDFNDSIAATSNNTGRGLLGANGIPMPNYMEKANTTLGTVAPSRISLKPIKANSTVRLVPANQNQKPPLAYPTYSIGAHNEDDTTHPPFPQKTLTMSIRATVDDGAANEFNTTNAVQTTFRPVNSQFSRRRTFISTLPSYSDFS